jgi:hypothetical protein
MTTVSVAVNGQVFDPLSIVDSAEIVQTARDGDPIPLLLFLVVGELRILNARAAANVAAIQPLDPTAILSQTIEAMERLGFKTGRT